MPFSTRFNKTESSVPVRTMILFFRESCFKSGISCKFGKRQLEASQSVTDEFPKLTVNTQWPKISIFRELKCSTFFCPNGIFPAQKMTKVNFSNANKLCFFSTVHTDKIV